MRSAILGAAVEDVSRLRALVRCSTRLTHTDPRAEHGALAVALAARLATSGERVASKDYLVLVEGILSGDDAAELLSRLRAAAAAAEDGMGTRAPSGLLMA